MPHPSSVPGSLSAISPPPRALPWPTSRRLRGMRGSSRGWPRRPAISAPASISRTRRRCGDRRCRGVGRRDRLAAL